MQGEVQKYQRPKDALVNLNLEYDTIKQLDQFDIQQQKKTTENLKD